MSVNSGSGNRALSSVIIIIIIIIIIMSLFAQGGNKKSIKHKHITEEHITKST